MLNSELCEPKLQISLEIDQLPDLNWSDGLMTMELKCLRHLKHYTPKMTSQKEKEKRNQRRREKRKQKRAQ